MLTTTTHKLKKGAHMKNAIKRLAGLITSLDIDETICKKVNCGDYDHDAYECADCIIYFYSRPCKWEENEVCVNDKSEWCADFVDNTKCGRCIHFDPINL